MKKQLKQLRETMGAGKEVPVIPFSSETRQGREEVWQVMLESLQQEEDGQAAQD